MTRTRNETGTRTETDIETGIKTEIERGRETESGTDIGTGIETRTEIGTETMTETMTEIAAHQNTRRRRSSLLPQRITRRTPNCTVSAKHPTTSQSKLPRKNLNYVITFQQNTVVHT